MTDLSSAKTEGPKKTKAGTSELYPAAVRAIEEDDLDRMKTLIEIESFTRDSLDELLYKACERSKDICVEENFIKNEMTNISNSEEEQSMLSICQTARKNNEQLLDLLVNAESKAELAASDPRRNRRDSAKKQTTPQKPVLRSIEKNATFTTPEMPKFKSKVQRELKY